VQKFKAKLTAQGPAGAWTFLEIPFNVEKAFGTKARVAVSGTLNGFAFQNSLMPRGDGTHSMMVSKALQAGAKAGPGDLVSVVMDVDRSERTVAIPDELKQRLAEDQKTAQAFEALSYSHKKEYAEWIASGKKEETRRSRVEKAVGMIRERKHVR
jgi:acetyl-CoA carboxylase beta subunit